MIGNQFSAFLDLTDLPGLGTMIRSMRPIRRRPLKTNIGKLVLTLGNALLKMRNAISLHHGLTASQMAVIIYLLKNQEEEEIHLLDIQNEFFLTHQTVNGLVKRLVSKGFVTASTSPRDKRSKRIQVTPTAVAMWKELEELSYRAESRLIDHMTLSEQEEFVRLLEQAIQNVTTPMKRQEHFLGQ